jgi:type I protein arginine methyltransferase
MYSLYDYGNMLADGPRVRAYAQAIAQAVRPGDSVLDIGSGPGVFALLACRAGARQVYAIESDAVIEVGKQLAAANGFSDRIAFLQRDSRKITLPERANVIVSDIRGALPLFARAIPSINDARERFLAPGGIMIPRRDTLKVAVVEADNFYSQLISAWRDSAHQLDLTPSLSFILNDLYQRSITAEQMVSESQTWGVLDYRTECRPHCGAELEFHAARNAVAHGICLWFETELFADVGFSSGPNVADSIYGRLFLPWLEPVKVVEGQRIRLNLQANLVGADYVWRWETNICAGGREIHFEQSTFQSVPLSAESLRVHAADYVPALDPSAQADRWLLEAMDGKQTLSAIAQIAAQRFPRIFPSWGDALRRASELIEKLS